VTGTPVGCACGDGLIDWHAVERVLKKAGFKRRLSVECGTEEQASKSIAYLKKVLQEV
jgi:Sugar phosphate isomerases/epimerases